MEARGDRDRREWNKEVVKTHAEGAGKHTSSEIMGQPAHMHPGYMYLQAASVSPSAEPATNPSGSNQRVHCRTPPRDSTWTSAVAARIRPREGKIMIQHCTEMLRAATSGAQGSVCVSVCVFGCCVNCVCSVKFVPQAIGRFYFWLKTKEWTVSNPHRS